MKKFVAILGWVLAAVATAVMAITEYLSKHPFPSDAPADSTVSAILQAIGLS